MKKEYFDMKYYGTITRWIHPLFKFHYTDAVRDFCLQHNCYWCLDVFGSYLPKLRAYEFLVVTFDVENEECDFYVIEDLDKPRLVDQKITWTDLDVSVRFYFTDNLLMFPSDY